MVIKNLSRTKLRLTSLLFCLSGCCLSAFHAPESLADKLKGKWKPEKIIYSLSSGDSLVQAPPAEFSFTGGNAGEQHEGYYQFNGKPKYTFLYQLESQQPTTGELIIAVLSPPGQPLDRKTFFGYQPDFSAIWTITETTGGVFKLKGEAVIRRGNGREETIPTEIQLKLSL